jgi:hypothetical protein
MRRLAVALLLMAMGMSAGCGDDADRTETTGSDASDLDVAIDEFGRAYIAGDVEQVMDLLAPADRESLTDQEVDDLRSAWSPAGEVEVEIRDLDHEIVRRAASSVDVTYSGQRCAPEVRYESPPTTASGGAGDQGSVEGSGSAVTGDVVCHDIAEAFEEQPPVEFIEVDGAWYGTLAGLGA